MICVPNSSFFLCKIVILQIFIMYLHISNKYIIMYLTPICYRASRQTFALLSLINKWYPKQYVSTYFWMKVTRYKMANNNYELNYCFCLTLLFQKLVFCTDISMTVIFSRHAKRWSVLWNSYWIDTYGHVDRQMIGLRVIWKGKL